MWKGKLAHGTAWEGSGKHASRPRNHMQQVCNATLFLYTECMNSELLEELMSSEGNCGEAEMVLGFALSGTWGEGK